MIDLVSNLSAVLAIAGALVVAWFGSITVYKRKGKAEAKAEHDLEELKADQAVDRKIDNADVSKGDSNSDLEWLRRRAERAKQRAGK